MPSFLIESQPSRPLSTAATTRQQTAKTAAHTAAVNPSEGRSSRRTGFCVMKRFNIAHSSHSRLSCTGAITAMAGRRHFGIRKKIKKEKAPLTRFLPLCQSVTRRHRPFCAYVYERVSPFLITATAQRRQS